MNQNALYELLDYAEARGLCDPLDRTYYTNVLCEALGLSAPPPPTDVSHGEADRSLCDILADLIEVGAHNAKTDSASPAARDLYDTALMGILTPRPSHVIHRFRALAAQDVRAATDWFYTLCRDVNYIRTDRVARDKKWVAHTDVGDLDITVNLSKPEKDPRAIAAARSERTQGYPPCALCHENEGFAGTLTKPARQNLRQIPFDMAGEVWYLQYSPYVYYNEHCIVLSGTHVPMKIDHMTMRRLLSFVGTFPHYFIGQNADLPIVGGSILTHDHMQGGRYTFAMERAPVDVPVHSGAFPDVSAGIVRWPMSVLRLRGADPDRVADLGARVLDAWRTYTDVSAQIFACTGDEAHNTVTPIARRRGEEYELDLVFRNNLTTPEHPLGLYHPHAERHNIKKENIGLIEVMGLAVLPARLDAEMSAMRRAILAGDDFARVQELQKHAAWFSSWRDRYTFTPQNTMQILQKEVGNTFAGVLSDAGVFKTRESFLRFLDVSAVFTV